MWALSVLFGLLVGLSLGLTGGGGAIFAVPLLVYGLQVPTKEAVGISLAAVGATSFVGFVHRWKLGEVEVRTGLLFAAAGMLGAPVGTWLAGFLPDGVLLLAFAGLMVIVAVRLWQQASKPRAPIPDCSSPETQDGPTCRRDASGTLILNSPCAALLLIVGAMTGVLSGLFGVGGGFVIVPALVLFSGMSIHRAVGTSLMVISLVSVSGIASQIWAGRTISPVVTGLFVVGGIAGLFSGQQIGRRLSGPVLQKVFVVAILAVAMFVIVRNLNS
ncbi:MAG: sulfite exporter TauE/SafE family protein [Planctomycetaceae bacterium]|nr:sulfite exporter TauE/SafE family protein [Planctomycetaceae bacterium]